MAIRATLIILLQVIFELFKYIAINVHWNAYT